MSRDTFYGRFVKAMFKEKPLEDGEAHYLESFGLIHAASGITGEAGEVGDLIKKHVFTGKKLYTDEIIKELGDLEFYLEALRQQLHVSRDEILQSNWKKLSQRHGGRSIEDYYAE